MLISIVTPVYNCEKYIEETMDSIHNQSYKNVQHIVIDGLSTDRSLEIVKKYENVTIVSEKDKGQTDAINKGFRLANGEILAWQNADDVYLPGALETVVDFFKSHPEVDVVYGSYSVIDAKSNWLFDVNAQNWSKWKFAHGRFVPMQPTAFWRRKVYDNIGDLDTKLHFCMDVDFFSKAASRSFHFHKIPSFLGSFRVHDESKTHTPNIKEKVLAEMREVLAKNFSYGTLDHLFFSFFSTRSIIAEWVKKNWLKRM